LDFISFPPILILYFTVKTEKYQKGIMDVSSMKKRHGVSAQSTAG